MGKNKKVTRKELLQPDEFMTFTGKLIRFGTKNKKPLLIGLVTMCLLLLTTSFVKYYQNRAEMKASAEFQTFFNKVQANGNSNEGKEPFEKLKPEIESLLDQYENKQSGKFALVEFAGMALAEKDWTAAIKFYSRALNRFEGNHLVRGLILNGLAFAHSGNDNLPEAIGYFKQAAQIQEPVVRDQALFNLAALYKKSGDPDKSVEAFQSIIKDHPDSIYAAAAKELSLISVHP